MVIRLAVYYAAIVAFFTGLAAGVELFSVAFIALVRVPCGRPLDGGVWMAVWSRVLINNLYWT